MTDYRTDGQLIAACLAGDGEAWNCLVQRYQRLVYSVALHQGLTAEDAEDVFQAVFVILLDKLDTCRDHERLASWLTTITRREAWRMKRERSAGLDATSEEALAAHASTEPTPEAALQQIVEQDLIRAAMARLGPRCRALLRRLFYTPERPSYADIAAELQMPEGSIGPTRARCLARLRKILQEMGFH